MQRDFTGGRFGLVGLLLVLAWIPLPLGSNRLWAIGVLAVAVCVVACVAALLQSGQGRTAKALAKAPLPISLLLGFVALVAAQLVAGVAPRFEGMPLATWEASRTRAYLIVASTHLVLFCTVLLVAVEPGRLRLLALAVVACGLVQALIAIVLFSLKAKYQVLWFDIQHGSTAIGTFVNRNHLAAYLYLCASVGIGLLVGAIDRDATPARRLRDHAITAMKFVMSRRMLLRLALVVMVVALVLTRSRMGNGAFFASLGVLALVVSVYMPALRKRALLIVLSLAVIDVVVVGQWVGLERVMQRIEGTALQREDQGPEETVEARTEPARQAVAMIKERPWFGYGGGTFYTVFPPYKLPGTPMLVDHAHNDYAEIAADTGLVGLGLLAGVVLATLWRIRRMLSPRQSALTRGIGYGALMAISCVLLHSWVDFNLQIPANALTFTVILAMAWAAPVASRRPAALDATRH